MNRDTFLGDSWRRSARHRRRYSGEAHQVVGGHGELELLIDSLQSAKHGLANPADGLAPTEVLLDATGSPNSKVTITLAGATHPWSNAITPLLQHFTKLTGIRVVTDFQSETKFLGALPIKLARGSVTPDVFMFIAYGQGISAGWLEPLVAMAERNSR